MSRDTKKNHKILITGCNGFLARHLVKLLQSHNYQVLLCSKSELKIKNLPPQFFFQKLDITHTEAIENVVSQFQPHYIINTAAITSVEVCERNPDLCFQTNVQAVENLALAAKKHNSFLLHYSTDFIFDGQQGPYNEEDLPHPLNAYGNSKLSSEKILKNSGA